MGIVEVIYQSWGWTGLIPIFIMLENSFGNLVIQDLRGAYWRICPEKLDCRIIASNKEEFARIYEDEQFAIDWNMKSLVEEAEALLGPLEEGYKYCLTTPIPLGGVLDASHLTKSDFLELLMSSGQQSKELRGSSGTEPAES